MVNILLPLSFENKIKYATQLCDYESTEFSLFDFIYEATTRRGKVRLWKILLTNICRNNCYYCVNRWQRNCNRFKLNPEKLAKTFWELFSKGKVEGLFLSSAEYPDPNFVQENMIRTIEILRHKFNYKGYIHCKVMPNVTKDLMEETSKLSSRVSINIEAPGEKYVKEIAPEKSFISLVSNLKELSHISKKTNPKASITTQLIIGIGKEDDRSILILTEKLYRELNLSRIFYSRFRPVSETPLECKEPCSPLREFRLYQADFLIRDYGFKAKELVYDEKGNLPFDEEPKYLWAKKNTYFFPIEINKASKSQLLKVPGIGKTSVKKIIEIRHKNPITHCQQLKGLRIDLDLIKEFLLFNGRKF
jgi:predicted DNA-binding helix-hairpin-helix protein